MLSDIRPAIVATLFFTLLLGVGYPLLVTGIAKVAFPAQAEGSLVRLNGKVVGSALIAQGFAKPEYLHPRASAAGNGYDPTSSGGTNLGPLNPDLAKHVKAAADGIRAEAPGVAIPADAVTTSASGLDPDVSPANAARQAARVAAARGVPLGTVRKVISDNTEGPWLGVFGQPHVNVLKTNLALDAALPRAQARRP
ncbi:potassium-transporting ATPase subunit KdpC [Phenylobacterium sp.]|uniref:potassium-transporting ATPase subunit KdpC n=1 Tax=Phenylobacterium sp. TaxID=1871053 RepID=UPI002DED5E08|nr:potassium-transporting ATPase subunit KdpC [Phenylobacterium sp.]